MPNVNIASVTATNAVTLTNKTWTTPVLLGTPASAGQIGRDATQLALNSFDNGMLGVQRRVIAAGVGTETFINSTASDQDFTKLMTFPSNTIFTNKLFWVTVLLEGIMGVSTVTLTDYLKLGSTKIVTAGALNQTNSTTRSLLLGFQLIGRSAVGASADVSACGFPSVAGGAIGNLTNQPVTGLATNAPLDLILGIAFSGTGSTESVELQGWTVEELN